MRLSVIQTSDDRRYLPMLQATEPLNRLYCQRHGFDFQPYVGMVRGCAPVHAAYNRIYLLHQRVLAGDTGWVLYMDADAWVRDMDFDVLGYLAQHPEHDFIAAEASALVPQVWAINNGVFFINLGSVAGQRIVHTWKQLADAWCPLPTGPTPRPPGPRRSTTTRTCATARWPATTMCSAGSRRNRPASSTTTASSSRSACAPTSRP